MLDGNWPRYKPEALAFQNRGLVQMQKSEPSVRSGDQFTLTR